MKWFRSGRHRVKSLRGRAVCPVCGEAAVVAGDGRVDGHERAANDGSGLVHCEGSWTWPLGREKGN